jgi:hypothetical protein
MTTASTSMAAAPYQELATAPGRMAGTPRRTDLPVRLLADGQLAHQEQRTYRRVFARCMSASPPPSVTASGKVGGSDWGRQGEHRGARMSVAWNIYGRAACSSVSRCE